MWVKGNLHCHTDVSDGDLPPSEAAAYYAGHGYHFLCITDHNTRVEPGDVNPSGLLLIPSEELSVVAEEDRNAPLHVNGFNVRETMTVVSAATKAGTIQSCIDAITAAGGIAQINHPNFGFAFDHTVMAETQGCKLFEVFNGHPTVHNNGDATHIPVEQMWDHLLSSGKLFYGTAVDDTHHYTGELAPNRANPSRGWIWARVHELGVADVIGALVRGDFYASTGVELEDVVAGDRSLRVVVRGEPGVSYVTRFIGDHGKVLEESDQLDCGFALPEGGMQTYVRAKVTSSDGKCAWTQPVGRFAVKETR